MQVTGLDMSAYPQGIIRYVHTSSAVQPPWPKFGVIGCAASPASVKQPEPNTEPGGVHLRTQGSA